MFVSAVAKIALPVPVYTAPGLLQFLQDACCVIFSYIISLKFINTMKTKTLLIPLLLSLFTPELFSQDAREIMKKAYEKCQSVRDGYYEMTVYNKYMTRDDTTRSAFNCHFSKLDQDTLYHAAFHYQFFQNGEHHADLLYTGEDFVSTNARDSTGKIMSKAKWAGEIAKFSHNQTFFTPLTHRESQPLPSGADFSDERLTFKYLGEVNVNNMPCHHIQIDQIPKANSGMIKVTGIRYEYWVSKTDFVPVQFSEALDLVLNKQAMHQYDRFLLTRYELNNLNDKTVLTLNSLPSWYRVMDYVPYEAPDPLPADTLAPSWHLRSLDGERISLPKLRGNLVLIDFFYKGCFPCIQALPALQRLHETYGKKGLTVIGIDPFDQRDDVADFLAKRGVTYPILLDDSGVSKAYRVSAYPTVYLIGRDGKILYMQVGYGEKTEERLRAIITQSL